MKAIFKYGLITLLCISKIKSNCDDDNSEDDCEPLDTCEWVKILFSKSAITSICDDNDDEDDCKDVN